MTDKTYDRYLRQLILPYWVDDPFRWEDDGVGIAFLAKQGDVGLFNLCWLRLHHTYRCFKDASLVSKDQYRACDMKWEILVAPHIKWDGLSISEHASLKSMPEFLTMLESIPGDLHGKFPIQALQHGPQGPKGP